MLKTAASMSPWALFLQADIVVKAVMIGLLLASIWSWAIILERSRRLSAIRRETGRFEERFWKAKSLDELTVKKGQHPAGDLFLAGMDEWQASVDGKDRSKVDGDGVRTRLADIMAAAIDRSISDLSDRLTILATVGSTAPFVGLFGTVWGIMSSFQSIAASKNTSLAVVAPGIAEALFATAIGLIAAIPATIFYNKFTAEVNRQAQRLEGFADEFSAILSRQIDERA